MKCGVVEGVKRNILRWFDHMERMAEFLEYERERGVRRMKGLEHARIGINRDSAVVAIP